MPLPELLEQVIAAQGGLERYRSAGRIRARVRCGGWAFALKRQRGALGEFIGTVSIGEPRTVIEPYGGAGCRGVFERGTVRIEDSSGAVLARRDDPRPLFRKFGRNLRWDDLDLLYFGGYALWGYLNTPFVFADPAFEVREIDPWTEHGETWRGLEVRFPADVPAHSELQRFYFDERGILRRNDYTAEVFGNWAKAAHYCWEHRLMDGLVVPSRRKALPRRRNGKPVSWWTMVSIAIDDVELLDQT
jgi:hypothetical protein